MKPPASETQDAASIPWDGVLSLASLWAGAGALYDWLHPSDWDINREWSADVARARAAQAILLHVQQALSPHLPKHAGAWLELLSQQTNRMHEYVDAPSAHTDWGATLSTFGRYPSGAYIDRRSLHTYDTSYTRVLAWTARAIPRANRLVVTHLGRSALTQKTERQFTSALELPELATVGSADAVSEIDVDACKQSGGVWTTIARIASLLVALWSGGPTSQLFALRPILPDFAHQLFELAVLGSIVSGVRDVSVGGQWWSATPIAAAREGRPCLTLRSTQEIWTAHYQTVPQQARARMSPYMTLSAELDGGRLRPDIWIEHHASDSGGDLQLLVECKYSLDPSYIASGVPQIFAYMIEFPPPAGTRRIHIVVGPDEVVDSTTTWSDRFAVTTPAGARQLCSRLLAAPHDALADLVR